METRKTTALSGDLGQPRRQRSGNHSEHHEEAIAAEEAGALPKRPPSPMTWPKHYYMTAQEWMQKVRLVRDHSTLH